MGKYKGNLEGVPDKVVKLMLKRQVEQGNYANVSVFEEDVCACTRMGGFDWDKTEEGHDVWDDVLMFGAFDLIPDSPEEIVGSDTHALDTWTERK